MHILLQSRWLLVGVFLSTFVGAGESVGLRADDSKPVRVDQYGAPLPDGVLRRLGTLCLVHLGELTAVAVSPDGKVVASGVRHGKETYLGAKTQYQSGGFSVGQGVTVTRTALRLWDAASGNLVREIETPDAPVSSIYFAPGGRTLFAGCGTRLCAWDVATGKKLWEQEAIGGGLFHYGVYVKRILLAGDRLITLHSGVLMCPVPQDGGFSCFYHMQKIVRLWDLKTGKPLPLPPALESTIKAEVRVGTLFHEVAVSPDGRFAAVLRSKAEPEPRKDGESDSKWKYADRQLQIIDLGTGKILQQIADDKGVFPVVAVVDSSPYQSNTFGALAFARDSRTVALAAVKEIWLVRTDTGRKEVLTRDLPESVFRLAFFAAGKQLAAELGDDSIRVWEVGSKKRIEPHTIGTRHFETAQAGNVIAAIHGDTVSITALDSGKPLRTFEGHRRRPAVRFAFHTADTLLSTDGKKALLWETRSWKMKGSLTIPGESQRWWYGTENMDEEVSWEMQLYIRNRDKSLELRDIKSDRLVRSLVVGSAKYRTSSFSATGNRFVTQEGDSWHFFDVETGKRLSKLPRSSSLSHFSNVLSPRGRFFTQWNAEDSSAVFDVELGKTVAKLSPGRGGKKRQGFTQGFWYSGDEQYVLSEFQENSGELNGGFQEQKTLIVLWDLSSGRIVQEFVIQPSIYVFFREIGMESRIKAVAMSNDHRFVAVVEKDGKSVGIWETASGTRRGELTGHIGPVTSVAFSTDGGQLASGSEDTTILIWDLNRPLQPCKLKDRLGEKELTAHWQSLLQSDAKQTDPAVWGLARAAKDSVPFLVKHLRPVSRPDGQRVRALLAALDNDDFDKRTKAAMELERYGERVLDELQTALKEKNSLDKQRLLADLVHKAQARTAPFGTPERVAEWRAVEVLERIGNPDARTCLRELAAGAPAAPLTAAARSALARLKSSSDMRK